MTFWRSFFLFSLFFKLKAVAISSSKFLESSINKKLSELYLISFSNKQDPIAYLLKLVGLIFFYPMYLVGSGTLRK